MIDVDGAEAGADVAGEEDGVEDEEGDEEQVEGRLHLRRADAGVGWWLGHFSVRKLAASCLFSISYRTACSAGLQGSGWLATEQEVPLTQRYGEI